jgi:hypothetical protein
MSICGASQDGCNTRYEMSYMIRMFLLIHALRRSGLLLLIPLATICLCTNAVHSADAVNRPGTET